MGGRAAALSYAVQGHDRVRETFERAYFARLVRRLLAKSPGGAMLDLGCGDGLAARLAGPGLRRYVGVDLAPPGAGELACLSHDLRQGLGPVGRRPFDLYLGTFGIASHLSPGALRRLLAEVAAHARPGALVALEALGLHSLEWPRLWALPPGRRRTIPYRLGADVRVHPWAPEELFGLYEQAGIRPLRAFDRTLQAGPKTGEDRYWPGLPAIRSALNDLLEEGAPSDALAVLSTPLPPLPAGPAALVHHTLAAWRQALASRDPASVAGLAESVWALEPKTCGGFGHGLLAVGRVGG